MLEFPIDLPSAIEQPDRFQSFERFLSSTVSLPREKELNKRLKLSSNKLNTHQKNKVQQLSSQQLVDRSLSLSHNHLLVNSSQINDLETKLRGVLDAYLCDIDINIHVEASTNYQAAMFTNLVDDGLVLLMSSGLIEDFSSDELLFIIGHEVGHYLLKHNEKRILNQPIVTAQLDKNSLLFLSLERAQETSADRVGLVFCQDLSIAISTILKISSLGSCQKIDINTNTYLNKFSEAEIRYYDEVLDDFKPWALSHPPMGIRIKLLQSYFPMILSVDKKRLRDKKEDNNLKLKYLAFFSPFKY